jgi:hypothetical protein
MGEVYIYYSERGYNPDASGSSSQIHLLTYISHLLGNLHYFAWEDKYGGIGDDKQFTDMVVSVKNITSAP